MKKRLVLLSSIVLVILLALFAFTACNTADTEYGEELIANGGFEEFTSASNDTVSINNWLYSSNWSNSEYALATQNLTSDNGERYLSVTNKSSANVYLYQEIKVDRRATYRITVDIKLPSSLKRGSNDTFRGAYVTFLENTGYYFVEQKEVVSNSETKNWVTLTFYVRPVNTDYMTICLSLGAENEGCIGTAYYDNVSMTKVESAPSGAAVHDFKKATISRYNENVSGILFVVFLSLASVIFLATAYILIRRLYSRPTAFLNFSQINGGVSKVGAISGNGTSAFSSPYFIGSMLALGTFLVNLIFLLAMYGFGSEMTYSVNLARFMGESGAVRSAYATYGTALSTTSPGTLYILSIIGAMGKNIDYQGVSILIRMVNVLASMATVVMIYLYGRKHVGDRQSTIFAALYALLPITLIMSGLDHSFTVLLVSLVVGALLLLVSKKYLPAYLVATLAILLDVRALAVVPLMLTYAGYMYYRDDSSLKKFTKNRAVILFGFLGCFVLLYILTIPVAIDYISAGKPFYGWTLIANQITNNLLLVDNGLGLYGMVAMNQRGANRTASVLNLVFLLVLIAYVISLYVKRRNKQELIMLASFTFAIVAVFTLKTDYTYLFLALAFGFIYTMISGEKRMYGIMGAYSLLAFLNVGQLMNNSGFVNSAAYFDQLLTADTTAYFVNYETTSPDFIIFSVLAVLVTLYYAYVSYSISNNGKLVDIPAMLKPFAKTMKDWFASFGTNVKKLFVKKDSE